MRPLSNRSGNRAEPDDDNDTSAINNNDVASSEGDSDTAKVFRHILPS